MKPLEKTKAQERLEELEDIFHKYFNKRKGWAKDLFKLLKSYKTIHRRNIDALDDRIYFMRDQLDRLVTWGIVSIHTQNNKDKPIIVTSNIYEEVEDPKIDDGGAAK